MCEFYEIVYSYDGKVYNVKILANSYDDAKKQFNENNMQFGNVMNFIDAYLV